MSKYSIKKAAVVLVIATVAEKLLGFGREMVIAKQFGASGLTDSYLAGYQIPYFIMALLNAGLVNVYAPVFISEWENDREEAWNKINSISTYLMIVLLVMTLSGIFFSKQIVSLIYPGFSQKNIEIAASISRIFFVGVFIYSFSIIEGSLLNCFRHFVYPLISISLLSLGIIGGVLIFGGDTNINSIGYGYVAGAALALIVQYIKIKHINGKLRVNFKVYTDFSSKFLRLLVPVLIAASMSQANVFVDRIFASYLPAGSMSYLGYGNKVVELPIMLFSGIIATIIFPDLIEYINREDNEKLRVYINRAIIINLIFLIPSFVGLNVLNKEIISLLYERDAFTSIDTIHSASSLVFYSPTIILYGGTAVVSKVYYSLKDTKTLMYISIFSIVLNALFNYIFMKPLGHNGLALATSLVAVFQFGAAYIVLKRKINMSMGFYVVKNLFKISAASCLMAGVIYGMKVYVKMQSLTIFVGLSIISGAAVYFLCLIIFRMDELNMLIDKIRKRRRVV